MKNLPKEFKNKIYIVIAIISVIALMLGVLMFFGINREDYIVIEKTTTTKKDNTISTSKNITTTTTNTTTNTNQTTTNTIEDITTTNSIMNTTTTTKPTESDEELAYNAITKYLDSFYIENYIKNYDILDIKILEEIECYNIGKDENKIYAYVSLNYEKINLKVEINPNEELITGNNFKLDVIYIINKNTYTIMDYRSAC